MVEQYHHCASKIAEVRKNHGPSRGYGNLTASGNVVSVSGCLPDASDCEDRRKGERGCPSDVVEAEVNHAAPERDCARDK